jgi:hypothetical protein
MTSLITSNVTSGFIDLATFDELEKYMYGSADATAYFVRQTRKSTWFTQVPVVLSRASGQADFGNDWSVSISRAGDYLLHTWLRLQLPAVTLIDTKTDHTLRWTRNLMHNIVREATITFNDLIAARFDSFHLDFWAAFTVPAGKRNGYSNMIGDFEDLTGGVCAGETIDSTTLNLPLPFFFSRDSGVALPTAALPYNEMRINFQFRKWEELLIMTDVSGGKSERKPPALADIGNTAPTISQCQVWANYAIVSNEERKRMACAPRCILIEQVQSLSASSYDPASVRSVDIRFAHSIKVLFFAVRNSTYSGEWSNYCVSSPVSTLTGINPFPDGGVDPILETSLVYENTARLSQMGSDYFSLVNPYYHAAFIPSETGYHSYSYSLDFCSLDPMGSTNYGKLTNVSLLPSASDAAKAAARKDEKYQFLVTAVNNNVIRISGGALGFPVL